MSPFTNSKIFRQNKSFRKKELPKEIKITQSIYKSQKNFYDPVLDNIARSITRNKQSGNSQSSLPTKSLCYFCGNQLP